MSWQTKCSGQRRGGGTSIHVHVHCTFYKLSVALSYYAPCRTLFTISEKYAFVFRERLLKERTFINTKTISGHILNRISGLLWSKSDNLISLNEIELKYFANIIWHLFSAFFSELNYKGKIWQNSEAENLIVTTCW